VDQARLGSHSALRHAQMSDLPDDLALRHDAIALHQYPASDLALLAYLIPIQNDDQGSDSVCNSR
jgi:hypothetical protein